MPLWPISHSSKGESYRSAAAKFTMQILRQALCVKPKFWILVIGLSVIGFSFGRLIAPPYVKYLRAHPEVPSPLKSGFLPGYPSYSPPSGATLIRSRQASFDRFREFSKHNIWGASISLAGGAIVFFSPCIVIAINGMGLGVTSFIDGGQMFFLRMMPHSLLEYPALLFVNAAGTQIGWTIFQSVRARNRRVVGEQLWLLAAVWLLASLLYLVAAFMETYIKFYVFHH